MLDENALKKYDGHGMCDVYDMWPEIARESYEKDCAAAGFDDVNHVVFVGMGGSGTVSDIFHAILSQTTVRTTVIKGYTLPENIDGNTLVVAISASGNTEETRFALKSSLEYDCMRVVFSAGGMIKEFAVKNGIEHRDMQMHSNPRSSLPAAVYTILKTLGSVLPVDRDSVYGSIGDLERCRQNIFSGNISDENPSIGMASHLSKISLIYYPYGLRAVATRFKNSIHENMKKYAMTENIIESCHNQISALDGRTDVLPILLRGAGDHFKTVERWDVLKEFFEMRKIEYKEFSVSGKDMLAKTMSSIYELDYATIYGAVMAGTDPYPIEYIERMKEMLKQRRT